MCGRTRVALAPERVEQATGVPRDRWTDAERYRPSYNVQPGQWTPILRLDDEGRPLLQTMKWGLVPSFTKEGEKPDHFRMFNARSESVTEKPIFSRLLKRQRCVVLAEGFYEWKAEAGSRKQPYYVNLGEGSVLQMAGLYDTWQGGDEGPLTTYTILTVDSSPKLTWLHNRMPVLLPDDAAVAAWLGCSSSSSTTTGQQQQQQECGKGQKAEGGKETQEGSQLETEVEAAAAAAGSGGLTAQKLIDQVCKPYNGEALMWHPVTPDMSKPSYNCPDASKDVRTKRGSISSFFKPAAGSSSGSQKAKQQQQQPAGSKRADGSISNSRGQQQQQHKKKGDISSFFKQAGAGSPAAKKQKTEQQQQQQQLQDKVPGGTAAAVRNPDEQKGPKAAEEAAAAAAMQTAGGSPS